MVTTLLLPSQSSLFKKIKHKKLFQKQIVFQKQIILFQTQTELKNTDVKQRMKGLKNHDEIALGTVSKAKANRNKRSPLKPFEKSYTHLLPHALT